jgi:hypothetical protein
VDKQLSRREVLGSGVLLGAALVLAGCDGARRATSSLPGPRWPGAAGSGPLVGANQPTAPVGTLAREPALPPGVLPRSSWTSADVSRRSDIYPMRGISRITVHHDGMPPVTLRSQGDVAARLETIRRAHVAEGWADIGYHYVIDPTGRVWEGRPVEYQGAHVKDNNEHNLGVMVLGNFQTQRPTREAIMALDRFVALQMRLYNVPLRRVYTHQEIRPTACPGFNLQRYMVQTRGRGGSLAAAAGGGGFRG